MRHKRKETWLLMEWLDYVSKFLNMIIQPYKDQHDQVRLNSDFSEPFQIINEVKQICVLVPTLFIIFFSMILEQVPDGDGKYIKYRLFNLRRLQSHMKTSEQLIRDLSFADGAAHTKRALQLISSCLLRFSSLGLKLGHKKQSLLLIYVSQSRGFSYHYHLLLLRQFHKHWPRITQNIHWSDFIIKVGPGTGGGHQQPRYTGKNTSLRWGIIAYQRSHNTANCLLAIATEEDERSDTKTIKKNLNACRIKHRR